MAFFDKWRGGKDSHRKDNELELEKLKDEIRNLTERARDKKYEYDKEKSRHLKEIIKGELILILDELDALKDRQRIITRNLRQIALAERKRKEAEVASEIGISEDELDQVAVEHEDAMAGMKEGDRAAEALEKSAYDPRKEETGDVEKRFAELEPGDEAPAERREEEGGLDERTLNRLNDLE